MKVFLCAGVALDYLPVLLLLLHLLFQISVCSCLFGCLALPSQPTGGVTLLLEPPVCHSPWFYLTLALVFCDQLVRRAVHSSFDRYLVVFACFLHLPLLACWSHFQVASFLTSSWAPSRTCTPPILQSFTPKFAKSVCLSSVFSFIVVFFFLWNFQQLPLSSS